MIRSFWLGLILLRILASTEQNFRTCVCCYHCSYTIRLVVWLVSELFFGVFLFRFIIFWFLKSLFNAFCCFSGNTSLIVRSWIVRLIVLLTNRPLVLQHKTLLMLQSHIIMFQIWNQLSDRTSWQSWYCLIRIQRYFLWT